MKLKLQYFGHLITSDSLEKSLMLGRIDAKTESPILWLPDAKLQYFGHLMQRADSLEKTLMQGKTEDRRRGWQKMK